MTEPIPEATLSISMTSFTNERIVAAISRLVTEFCKIILEDEDLAWRFQMAANELAENVVRYSTGSRVSIDVKLEDTPTSAVLRVRTSNQTTPERLREVEARLQELTRTRDPIELYDRMIRETAPKTGVSGLGLARIRAEGELDLEYSIDGSALSISVYAPVTPRKDA